MSGRGHQLRVEVRRDLIIWLNNARGGQKYIYATRHVLDLQTPPEVQAVALEARLAYARGEVELVQKRQGKYGPFEYTAIRKREKRVPLVNKLPWKPYPHKASNPTEHYKSREWLRG